MKKALRNALAGISAMAMLAMTMTGCANSAANRDTASSGAASAASQAQNTDKSDYDFYIFNTKGENADALDAAVAAYEQETGLVIKTFSLGSGTNSDDALRADMNSDKKPAIFSCMNSQGLVEWIQGGFAMDLSEATVPAFQELANGVDDGLRLKSVEGTGNYGIPYNVEGYGYIVDKDLVGDLFGADQTDAVLAAFKAASYDEFAAAVGVLDAYIKDGTAGSVTLNGQAFPLAAEKAGKAATLEAVFSVAGSEKWTYGDHLVNIPIDAVFASSSDAAAATAEQVEQLHGPMLAYAKVLDLKTSHALFPRGPELINSTTNGYDAAVQAFAQSKTIFMKQGNWCYTNYEKANPDFVESLTFIPIKMPFQDGDVVASGVTAEKINTSIPVFVPNYYCLNSKVSDKEKEEAQKFLVWLNTSEAGQKFVVEDMAFIPYNADPATTTVDNSLGKSIIEYMASGSTITNSFAGAPTGWATDTFGQKMMESYLTKADWTEQDYEDIASFAVSSWKEKAGM